MTPNTSTFWIIIIIWKIKDSDTNLKMKRNFTFLHEIGGVTGGGQTQE